MSEIESTDRPQVLGGRWATHILLARGDARGRRSAACWVLLLMSGVRIRLRINGSDGGSLRAETSWSKADLVAAAKVKLLAESERALVDDAKVKLYLQGGDEIDGPGELEKDDVVWVAFTGSHYKEKRVETDAALPSLPPQPPDVPPAIWYTGDVCVLC